MPFKIISGDITTITCDAIVNPTNKYLEINGGVGEAILNTAGKRLVDDLTRIGNLSVGHAVITDAYNLPCKKIIHVASPLWKDGLSGEDVLLASCYTEALRIATENDIRTIAFPLIAGGSNAFPSKKAFAIAKESIENYIIKECATDVLLVIYSDNVVDIDKEPIHNNESDVKKAWFNDEINDNGTLFEREVNIALPEKKLEKNFTETFRDFLIKKNVENTECYKNANIDRKLFSKIVNGSIPKKRTILALCIALRLNLAESETLLNAAGYTVSHSFKTDLIFEYFVISKKYNVFALNRVLRKNNLPLLGSV